RRVAPARCPIIIAIAPGLVYRSPEAFWRSAQSEGGWRFTCSRGSHKARSWRGERFPCPFESRRRDANRPPNALMERFHPRQSEAKILCCRFGGPEPVGT